MRWESEKREGGSSVTINGTSITLPTMVTRTAHWKWGSRREREMAWQARHLGDQWNLRENKRIFFFLGYREEKAILDCLKSNFLRKMSSWPFTKEWAMSCNPKHLIGKILLGMVVMVFLYIFIFHISHVSFCDFNSACWVALVWWLLV